MSVLEVSGMKQGHWRYRFVTMAGAYFILLELGETDRQRDKVVIIVAT